MRLQLNIQDSIQHRPAGTFLRGNDPKRWLQEISRWQIPAVQLVAYLVPESIYSNQVAGLFVVFSSSIDHPQDLSLLDAYGVLAGKLYVPIEAKLFPEVGDAELAAALLYDCNLFHPSIGLVGFNKSDRLDWMELLQIPPKKPGYWSLAISPIVRARPRLKQIDLDQPPGGASSTLDTLRQEIDPRSLDDLPKDGEGMIDKTLSAGRNLLDRLGEDLPKGGRMGEFFGKVGDWMSDNLKALEDKRKNEVNRLLKMFDTDPEEALRYSIPLGDRYKGRGTAPPSGRLFRRDSTDFNIGRIGGGGRMNNWNLGSRFFDLQKRYYETAERFIREGKFRKAAYIYAHLLGDFTSAANVLIQGKYYRDAAELYLKHLRDLPAAAKCLENGGLLLEAIGIYRKLRKMEKVGDLYLQLAMTEEAIECYKGCVLSALDNEDYLNAARITHDKLGQPRRSDELLLEGWENSRQAQRCLQQYFRQRAEREKESIGPIVQQVFAQQTTEAQRPVFLNVLLNMKLNPADRELQEATRQIAYVLISEQVAQGQMEHLSNLSHFAAEDWLIDSDSSRYRSKAERIRPQMFKTPILPVFEEVRQFQLDGQVAWFTAIQVAGQMLVLGRKKSRLILARTSFYGHVEYFSWKQPIRAEDQFCFITGATGNGDILLYSSVPLEDKTLPANNKFYADIRISSPVWLPKEIIGLGIGAGDQIVTLSKEAHNMQVFDKEGALKYTKGCTPSGIGPLFMPHRMLLQPMFFRKDHFYLTAGNAIIRLDLEGHLEYVRVEDSINFMQISAPDAAVRLLIHTQKYGCQLYRPERKRIGDPGPFFGQNLPRPHDAAFVADNMVVVDNREMVVVYQSQTYENSVITIGDVGVPESGLVKVLPTDRRNQFLLVGRKGSVVIYEVKRK